jgi:hypothetical protein
LKRAFSSNRAQVLDVDALAYQKPVQIRDIAAEQPLNHTAQLLAWDFLERNVRRAMVSLG